MWPWQEVMRLQKELADISFALEQKEKKLVVLRWGGWSEVERCLGGGSKRQGQGELS